MVDWGATRHLVWGDEPFVTPREDVIGKFAVVYPPAIAIDA